MEENVIRLSGKKRSTFMDQVRELLPEGGNLNLCLTCGACSSGCPATGLEGMDPRKFLRMAALGLDDEIAEVGLGIGRRSGADRLRLHLAGADWTYGSKGWGGENYCMFLADDDAWKHITEHRSQTGGPIWGAKSFSTPSEATSPSRSWQD